MSLVRETIHAALETKLIELRTATTFKTVDRIWDTWENFEPKARQPALLINPGNETSGREKGGPPPYGYNFDLVVYSHTGGRKGEVPAIAMNALLDAVDAKLAPDIVGGFQDLGLPNMVSHCMRVGDIERYEGTLGPQAVAMYPLIVVPNADAETIPGQFVLGTGTLYAIPRAKPRGGAADQTPLRLGTLKNVTLDVTMKHTFPGTQLETQILPARTGVSIACSAQLGSFSGRAISQIWFGQNVEAGNYKVVRDEAQTIPASPGPYTVTITSPGTYDDDLGVVSATDASNYSLVTGVPATGEYSRAANVYTFAAADATKVVAISHLYTLATSKKVTLANRWKDLAPTFVCVLNGRYDNRQMTVVLKYCVTERFTMPTVLDQFMLMGFEFQALAGTDGAIGSISADV